MPSGDNEAAVLVAQIKAARQASKVWLRKHRSPPHLYHNCYFIIRLLDYLEEFRPLIPGERCLRDLCSQRLELYLCQRAAYWKQRAKFRALKEGDANTKFFHARASGRRRKNQIATITVDGVQLITHQDKSDAMTAYYTSILGITNATSWNFDLSTLYNSEDLQILDDLILPFTEAEALLAVKSMNVNSAPGPDGFGPAWYSSAWSSIKDDIIAFLSSFYNYTADLHRINRAHIVLLPKCPGASSPKDFRPVSLQNCPVKIITKILTTRMQRHIQKFIDIDQTGFIRGRSISENFVYATELVQHCHRNKIPTVVLKLDFAKAFDSVSWDSTIKILAARAFPDRWLQWMQMLFSSSHSAVLINGCPGNWITCKRGLRQGDALSPYLFVLVADVLQRLIKHSNIRHPAVDGPCPVLQYADDTLLLVRAEIVDIRRLKVTLDSFAMATGLKINYSKSTLVPMHVPQDRLERIVRLLQCQQASFPQVYLGLPLSNVKLNLAAFAPLISKVDRRLSGWQAALLNHQSRLVLINSVLDGLATYMMQALALPPGIISAIDSRRRAFLWSGKDKTSGAKCLVKWDDVQRPSLEGGLGVKDLATQNACLLLKLLHRLHHPEQSAWAAWVREHKDILNMSDHGDGSHWSALRSLLPAYRCITKVQLGDGRTTSFWHDSWFDGSPLATVFPCLFSHCTKPDASASEVLTIGLQPMLVSRLSPQASEELHALNEMISNITLTQAPDSRYSKFAGQLGTLHASAVYQASKTMGSPCNFSSFVWRNRAPPRVRFFGWLLVNNRIQCRYNLHLKHVLDDDICQLCGNAAETADHLIFRCLVPSAFWNHIGWTGVNLPEPTHLWEMPRPPHIPAKHFLMIILLCCWQIWNHRHDVVFRHQQPCLSRLLYSCRETCRLWSSRLRSQDRSIADHWCNLFVMN